MISVADIELIRKTGSERFRSTRNLEPIYNCTSQREHSVTWFRETESNAAII